MDELRVRYTAQRGGYLSILGTVSFVALLAQPARSAFELGLASRNPLFWVRLLALGLYSAATPLVFQWLADWHLPAPLLLVGASSTLVVLTIADCASSPFGSEGARLSLYLTAPVRPAVLVRAKFVALAVPALALAYGAIVVPAWWLGASLGDLAVSGLLVTPLVLGVVALVVGGSVADSNLDLVIEGALQQLIDEESPLTPQRMALVGYVRMPRAGHNFHAFEASWGEAQRLILSFFQTQLCDERVR